MKRYAFPPARQAGLDNFAGILVRAATNLDPLIGSGAPVMPGRDPMTETRRPQEKTECPRPDAT